MTPPSNLRARRRGALLAESAVAAAILMVAFALTLQLLAGIVAQRRAASHRQLASQAASNVLGRIAAWPRESLTPERLATVGIDPETARLLPASRLRVTLGEAGPGNPPRLRRVAVEVRWTGAGGRDEAPVRLVAWLAGPGGSS
jgi:hypothetical protein